ncbi:diflavin flavoprotein [Alkalinema sp. FACHB-956]|uniref:diflavin flavoprotein n=1 Tax=Alkalinema sp. FACHB-956 TaxID=2692768 RepID=UPI001686185A|nr:diflavin flavoprotein [Alkalinema sp. FACHB-956]MBD2325535.1 flavin reductase [Alkalinema sp. FACHB-956]
MVSSISRTNQTSSPKKRLTLQHSDIALDTTVIRSLDWDRDRFDIEFALQNGTTYNSFLIRGEKTALIDTSHEKFRDLYLNTLTSLIDPKEIDYLIVSHTEPDHSGLVKDILQLNPDITVVAAKVALQFLDDLVHQPYNKRMVKSGEKLDLGKGHVLEFISAPNLHWPDTIFTYDPATQHLFTCDAFGMHYCDDYTYDEDLELIEADFRIYYECLMAPNAKSVLSAIKRMGDLPGVTTIATGHGPLIQHNLTELVGRYQTWSSEKAKAAKNVVVFYVSGYGDADQLSGYLANGVLKTDVLVESIDLSTAELTDVRYAVEIANGIIILMPPQSGEMSETTATAISTILATANSKQAYGLCESGGGIDEPVHTLRARLQEAGLTEAFPPIKLDNGTGKAVYQLCEESGTDIGQWLTRDRAVKQMKALNHDLDKALGRLSGGLYIITAQKGDVKSAMLASWVSQASFKPLGLTIAVAKDRAIESLMRVGDKFVLNVLEEGNYQLLMKHFLKRFAPGADRFEGVNTQPAQNGSPILTDALAYLECEVQTRMECSDHWLVYATVDVGRVSNLDSLTAVHHRKVGNHY